MLDCKYYIPIIKWKRAERGALQALKSEILDCITPVVELQAISIDYATEEFKQTPDEYLEKAIRELKEVFDKNKIFFIDTSNLIDEDGNSFAAKFYERARQNNLKFIPVTNTERDYDEINACLRSMENGLCLRINIQDLDTPDFPKNILDFIAKNNVSVEKLDLILDFAASEMPYSILKRTCLEAINIISDNIPSRTLVFAMTSMPENMSRVVANGTETIERREWLIWKDLLGDFKRKPLFGDYGIQHPEQAQIDPRYMNPSANIRYTLKECFLILKGRSFRDHGGEQFRDLARKLVASGDFFGSRHCAGCNKIALIAELESKETAGNLEKWRKIGSMHHFTLTVEQIHGSV